MYRSIPVDAPDEGSVGRTDTHLSRALASKGISI
jgi:hypothetical protein